jgi:hypothetical protein
MSSEPVAAAITASFIAGMIWLRARMQYVRRGSGPLQLQLSGRIYFGSALACLAVGAVLAPVLSSVLGPVPTVTPTVMRLVWFLSTYFVFIIVHRVLMAQGRVLYRVNDPPGPPDIA